MKKRKKSTHRRDQALPLFFAGAGLILLGVIVGIWLLQANEKASAGGLTAGDNALQAVAPAMVDFAAPDLSLHDLKGRNVSLRDFRGSVVLVNNWATWCPPCRAEMPILQDYFDEHIELGFSILAVSAGEPPAVVAAFVDQYGLTFPVLIDPTNKSIAAFKNPSLPSSYLIDREGRVKLAWLGPVNRKALDQYLTPLLEP